MNKIFIVLLFILLGSSLIVINNIKGNTENSFIVEYQNNKNISLPDLTGKTEILIGVYRLVDTNGITIDYNIYNGYWIINGTTQVSGIYYIFNNILENNTIYTINKIVISNPQRINFNIASPTVDIIIQNYSQKSTFTTITQNNLRIHLSSNNTYNNLTFKLQLEKGSTATSYVVPKLIPIYKDNLTKEEKQQIGMGAFEGIPQIIRTINNILKPVTDFVNGILSLFS